MPRSWGPGQATGPSPPAPKSPGGGPGNTATPSDDGDLVRVSQYIAVQYDPTYPKELILKLFEKAQPPDFRTADEPHGVLADLPLSVYMTTNYDDFMVRA